MIYGYARVSTKEQDHTGQVELFDQSGCAMVFSEKLSGVTDAPPELQPAIAGLDAGDILMVTRVDRLARSTRDLLNITTCRTGGARVPLARRAVG